ncbi:hypothetical protein ONZ45_g788 [Pleurotus djamor]|nr:hypothetical protein ONZ45_g788 [Pleurotus djamor]
MNIFGTASGSASGPTHKKWKKQGDEEGSDNSDANEDGKRPGRGRTKANAAGGIGQYFALGSEKTTGMRMSYEGGGHPLTLLIAEDAEGPTTACEIITYEPEPHLELPFDPDNMVLKIILKVSSWLGDALSELDASCEKLTFIGNASPDGPPQTNPGSTARNPDSDLGDSMTKTMLRIQAEGTFGTTEMDYPNDREVLETFECEQSVSFSYRTAHITRAIRALQSSTKTSLRIDATGLMSLQFLMPSPSPKGKAKSGSDAFIEFRCLPLEEAL